MIWNQSLLEHSYSANKTQQSSGERNHLPTQFSASDYTPNESDFQSAFSNSPPSSLEGIYTIDVINAASLSEEEYNVHRTSVSSVSTPNITSVIQDKTQAGKDLVIGKNDAKKTVTLVSPSPSATLTSVNEDKHLGKSCGKRGIKKKTTIMEEALEALKRISNEKVPQVLQPPSKNNDACEYMGLFVAARLREMEPDKRSRCEIEIMKILTTFTIET